MEKRFSSARSHLVRALFDKIVQLPEKERAVWLEKARKRGPDVCNEVIELLRAYEKSDDLLAGLDRPIPASDSTEQHPDPLLGRITAGYRLLENLGGGGAGTVYKAGDLQSGQTFALKFLRKELVRFPSARQRFIQEAKAAAMLDHPNICTIHAIKEADEGQPFFVMDFYEGESLRDRIKRGPLPVHDAIDITIQIANGLSEAHWQGIIHRDVKPSNVIVTIEGSVILLDFGISKITGIDLTKKGVILGTIAYMSPEQARGQPVDPRTDVWSLGVILYEMLSGVLPFEGHSNFDVVHSILHVHPPHITLLRPEVPDALSHITDCMLQKDPDERFQHMDEVIRALKNLNLLITP